MRLAKERRIQARANAKTAKLARAKSRGKNNSSSKNKEVAGPDHRSNDAHMEGEGDGAVTSIGAVSGTVGQQ